MTIINFLWQYLLFNVASLYVGKLRALFIYEIGYVIIP